MLTDALLVPIMQKKSTHFSELFARSAFSFRILDCTSAMHNEQRRWRQRAVPSLRKEWTAQWPAPLHGGHRRFGQLHRSCKGLG